MANFDPNQPRNAEGEWTIASSAAWKAAGLRTEYDVPERANVSNINFSGQDFLDIDNSSHPPVVWNKYRYIKSASATDKEAMKQIARHEKEFYDNPNSTGFEEHVEVRLEKGSAGYQIRYVSFDTKSGEVLSNIWNDFCRCPLCKFPTITPEETEYSSCSTCKVEYKDE